MKFAVLVLSCDKYSDLWNPFFYFFKQNWPDCPYRIYVGSNEKKCEIEGVDTLYSGVDKNWSTSYKTILNQIPENFLFVILEDLFLTSPVNNHQIHSLFHYMKEFQAKHIHFKKLPVPSNYLEDGMGVYDKSMPYRVNVAGFWEKKYLYDLLMDGESPWNFEIMGSYRSQYDRGFYCSHPDAVQWINAVEKGKWFRKAIKLCNQHQIRLDQSRQVLSRHQEWISLFKIVYCNIIMRVDWRIRLKLMNIFRKLIVSY